LLKDKADLFFTKMLERKLEEEECDNIMNHSGSDSLLSQDSENYNDEYKMMVKNKVKDQDQDREIVPDEEEKMSFDSKHNSIELCMENTVSKRHSENDAELSQMNESINKDARQNQMDEVESVYSGLNESMNKRKQRDS
jgi:hypothetical protein